MKDIIISGLGVRLEGRKLLGNSVGSLVGRYFYGCLLNSVLLEDNRLVCVKSCCIAI